MCHVFPAWSLTGLFSKLKYSKRACERTSRSILHIWWLAGSNLEFCFCSFSHTAGKTELIFYFYFFIFSWTWKIIGFQPALELWMGFFFFQAVQSLYKQVCSPGDLEFLTSVVLTCSSTALPSVGKLFPRYSGPQCMVGAVAVRKLPWIWTLY